jgi:predicted metal-binding membrane protein
MGRHLLASPSAQHRLVLLLLLATAGACWVLLLAQGQGDGGMDMPMASPTMGLSAPAFVAIWTVMMVAMMFPTAAPMITTFHRIGLGNGKHGVAFASTWLFVAGYMAVWTVAGAAAYLSALLAETSAAHLAISAAAAARSGGGLIMAAGLYQLTPIKNVCLAKCRSPIGFVLTSWRAGPVGAVQMGVLHGAYCLGCCWLLFIILFPLGIMNIAAMALITLVVFAEKALPWKRLAVHGTAAALIAYGALVAAVPHALPTLAAPRTATGMPAGSGTHAPAAAMTMMPMATPGGSVARPR